MNASSMTETEEMLINTVKSYTDSLNIQNHLRFYIDF